MSKRRPVRELLKDFIELLAENPGESLTIDGLVTEAKLAVELPIWQPMDTAPDYGGLSADGTPRKWHERYMILTHDGSGSPPVVMDWFLTGWHPTRSMRGGWTPVAWTSIPRSPKPEGVEEVSPEQYRKFNP